MRGKIQQTARANSHGFTNCLSMQCGLYYRDFLNEKSRSPLFPRGGGQGGGGRSYKQLVHNLDSKKWM